MFSIDDRKKQILAAIIEDYIKTAEPIGSRTISKNHKLELSPATIRNEMADLEELGLLVQPHTSAGRIPTDLGYRIYVDQLMHRYRLSVNEINKLSALMQLKISELDMLISEVSAIFSKLTNYTVVAMAPSRQEGFIKHLHLLLVDEDSFLAVLITDKNIVRDKVIRSESPVEEEQLQKVAVILNGKIARRSREQITEETFREITLLCDNALACLPKILEFIYETLDIISYHKVHVGGVSSLLAYPEYRDVGKAKELLEFLESGDNLQHILSVKDYRGVKVIIGDENQAIELKDCSIVLSAYTAGEQLFGAVGLIGPTRMNYSKAVSNLEFFTNQLNKLLEGEGKKDE